MRHVLSRWLGGVRGFKTMRKRVWTGAAVVAALLVAAGLLVYVRPMAFADRGIRFHLWRAGVESRYVDVDGVRVHFFEAAATGGGGGTPLVLIHGLAGRGEDWSPLIPRLAAAGFHVYAPDLLGYGRSPRPDASYSISMQEKLVAGYMRAMGIGRADVVGWSMGGWVAMKLAIDDAPMVDRMVLFDAAGVYFPGYSDLGDVFVPADVAGVGRLMSLLTPHPPRLPEFLERDVMRRIQGNGWVIRRSLAAMTSGRDLLNFRLGEVTQPTLVVWGKQDVLIPIAAGETLHRGIPGSSMLVVDGCGHLAPIECAEASLKGTVDFLRAQPAIRGAKSLVQGR